MAGRLPQAWLDELRDRADIVQVVSRYVQLNPKGGRYWGLCPFHGEKTPSFSVNPQRQMYYCFGCHAGGSAITFVMEMEHLDFMEAVKLLAEQVEDQIYHYILDEALEPGAKLPNEFALGEKFRVGRSTIREAVKLLSSKGIVEVRQGSGTYVVTTVKGLSDPLNLRSVQDKNALAFDLVNVRLLLEPGIAEMAAQNATPEDIERLRRLCERVETKIHEGDRYIEDDIAFHTCIAESSKNMVVEQLIPIIDTAVMMFVNVTHKKLIDETIMTHRMITEAIANHDPIGAKAAMVMHLNFNRSYIKKVYDGEDPDDGTIGMAAYVN